MSRPELAQAIKGGLLLDGAMGTELIARGVEGPVCTDQLSRTRPDLILGIHRAYFEAGSGAVLTNSFGASAIALARHGLADSAADINKAAAVLAREAAGEDRYVLGDIGPCTELLEPYGTLEAGRLREAFAGQAAALSAGGVDGFLVESMTAVEEAVVGVEAVRGVCGLPVFASLAFDSAGGSFRTMMGVDVDTAVDRLLDAGVVAVGFNCGRATLDEYVELAGRFVSKVGSSGSGAAVLAEPNAGLPSVEGGRVVYGVTAREFAAAVASIREAGVSIIGGCCGTGPSHIAAAAAALGR
jgi:5-methyltetrahydrofolate--homocysteine methyltransferase